jgi:hypothetical protein
VKSADCFGYLGSAAVVRQLSHVIAQATQRVAPAYVAAFAYAGADQESEACCPPEAAILHRVRRAMVARLTFDRAMSVTAAE